MIAPEWFLNALAVPYTDETVVVNECDIHYVAWGQEGRRGLVFVHGGGAHAHWWTHVAATFATTHRVAAIDLSGHGDSGRRESYPLEQWADEVMAVASAAGMVGRPIIIGHSMGGFVTIVTAAQYGDDVAGVVVCDSPVTNADPEVTAAKGGSAFGVPKVYATVDEALRRFRTVPEQANYLDYVMDNVGPHSLRPVEDGWSWKFDHRVFERVEHPREAAQRYLAQIRCRFALLRAEHGLVTADIGEAMYDMLGRVNPVIEIPEAGHHLMLDQPLLLLTALRTLLADWDHSLPRARA